MKPCTTLKVAMYANPVIKGSSIEWDTDNRYFRLGVRLSEIISQGLSCKYEISFAKDGQFGRLTNGSWTGMVGMVNSSKIDLAISELSVTEERSQAVDFSYPFLVTKATFVTEKPEIVTHLTTVLQPFSWQLWSYLALLHIIMPFMFYTLLKAKYSFSKLFLDTCATFFGQQCFKYSQRISERVLIISWMFGMMIIGFTYKANLLSILTIPTLNGVRVIPELSTEVEKGKYECITYPGGYYADEMLKSNDRTWQIIGRDLQKNPGSHNIEEALQGNSAKKTAFIGTEPAFTHLRNKYFVSEDSFFIDMSAIAMRKGFWYKEELNEIIFKIQAGGLYNKIVEDEQLFEVLQNTSEFAKENIESIRPLSLDHVYSAFCFSFFGYLLAIACFVIEFIAGTMSGKKLSSKNITEKT